MFTFLFFFVFPGWRQYVCRFIYLDVIYRKAILVTGWKQGMSITWSKYYKPMFSSIIFSSSPPIAEGFRYGGLEKMFPRWEKSCTCSTFCSLLDLKPLIMPLRNLGVPSCDYRNFIAKSWSLWKKGSHVKTEHTLFFLWTGKWLKVASAAAARTLSWSIGKDSGSLRWIQS